MSYLNKHRDQLFPENVMAFPCNSFLSRPDNTKPIFSIQSLCIVYSRRLSSTHQNEICATVPLRRRPTVYKKTYRLRFSDYGGILRTWTESN